MERDFSKPILDLLGAPLVDNFTGEALQRAIRKISKDAQKELYEALEQEGARVLTLGAAAAAALVAGYEDERNVALEEKAKRMQIALRVCNGGLADVTSDDIVKIKQLVNKRYAGALIPVRCADILEAAEGANPKG